MKSDKSSLLLYLVTDRAWVGEKTLYEQLEEAISGGVSMVQLREKELDDEAFLAEAQETQLLCRKHGIPLIINDRVELAAKINADGAHIGQGDMPAEEARKILGKGKILGVSVQNTSQAAAAEKSGADYLGVGAVFPTSSKADAEAVSLETLKEICGSVSIPVVAIGGISKNNVCRLAGSGICGIAAISAVLGAADIKAAAAELRLLAEKAAAHKSTKGDICS